VHIHFTGWLPDGTQFHTSRGQPNDFGFVLGEAEVNKGLDIGVATMQRGERSRFVLSPEFGYGEGIPGKIPANATLTFEVELLGWKGKTRLTLDGGVQKIVQQEGTGQKKPSLGQSVLLHYVGHANGAEFIRSLGDEHVDVSSPNPLRLPTNTWQMVLTSMSQNEKALVTLTSPYAYGDRTAFDSRVSAGSTVTLELHLLEVYTVEDCGLFKALAGQKNFPRVMKKEMAEGSGCNTPNVLSEITAKANGKILTWQLMAEPRCEAIECAVLTMKKGAKCIIKADDPSMCQDAQLCALPTHNVEVELLDFHRTPDTWDLLPDERIDKGSRLKQHAASLMKTADYRRACWVYRAVQDLMGYVDDWPDEQRRKGDELRQACKSNEVLAWLKLEQFQEAADLCTEILCGGGISVADPCNVKALFRRGSAHLSLGDLARAKHDFESVLEHDPDNKEAKQQLAQARRQERAEAKKSQDLMRGMIGGAGKMDYPVGYTSPEGERERQHDAMLDKVDEIKAKGILTL